MSDLFESASLLDAYDTVLPLAAHYRSVLKIHVASLGGCDPIIDLGCGTGMASLCWLKKGRRVCAVDMSELSLERLRARAASDGCEERLSLFRADVSRLSGFEASFFGGGSSMIVAHLLRDYDEHLRQVFRVLRPGGKFVLTGRTPKQDPEKLVEITRASLACAGRFMELMHEFELVSNVLLRTANERSQSLRTVSEAIETLTAVGFEEIRPIHNATEGLMYSITAHKPA